MNIKRKLMIYIYVYKILELNAIYNRNQLRFGKYKFFDYLNESSQLLSI